MRAAVLNDRNEVENIIVADEAFCEANYPGRYVMLTDRQWCDIGAIYDGKAFRPAT